jgi:energy-coupling factor transporter transmembrane protein EcfT
VNISRGRLWLCRKRPGQNRDTVSTPPWSYRSGNTPLHRAPAMVKLAGLFAVTTLALVFSLPGIAAGGAVVCICAVLARISPFSLLRGARPVAVMSFTVLILRVVRFVPPAFDPASLPASAPFCLTLFLSFAAGSLLFSVTTVTEMREGLRPVLGSRFSLALSLMLGYLPRFFAVWEETAEAWRARGGKRGVRALFALLSPVIARMIALAGETAEAMESRASS